MSWALKTEGLSIQFGGLKALTELNLEVKKGQIFGLIGPNGAGKTTVFNLLTGVYCQSGGSIGFWDKMLEVRLKPYHLPRLQVARTFQNIRLFKDLSVIENLMIALDHNPNEPLAGKLSYLLRDEKCSSQESARLEICRQNLRLFGLEEKQTFLAKNLSYGEQRRLEMARAIVTGAKLILLDEPAAGLNPQETMNLLKTIRSLREKLGLTVLLIEHDMKLVMSVCEKIAVLDYGVKIAEGTPAEIQKHPAVIEAYLGKDKNELRT